MNRFARWLLVIALTSSTALYAKEAERCELVRLSDVG